MRMQKLNVSSCSTDNRSFRRQEQCPTARLARDDGLFTSNLNCSFHASLRHAFHLCHLTVTFEKVPRHELPPTERPAYLRQLSNSKSSLLSTTPSFEADDEDSSSDQRSMQGSLDVEGSTRQPRYHGEDTRLTSKKELQGWYSYGFAAEVFVVCGVGTGYCSVE